MNGRAKCRSSSVAVAVPAPTQAAVDAAAKRNKKPPTVMDDRLISRGSKAASKTKNQRVVLAQQRNGGKTLVGYQSAAACYVGGGGTNLDSAVYGVFSETKYTFAVNGLPPGNSAQASAAAAFFARCVQFQFLRICYK